MSKAAGLDQTATPLVDALQHCATQQNAAFHTPGHKRGQGITNRQRKLFGRSAFQADLPELPDLDNLFAPEGVILQAQQLAAEAFGPERTWFLANGSTCGIEAAILATCGPGDKIILPRNVHSSAISGLILSGAIPIYIAPSYSEEWDLALHIQPSDIEAALSEHPDAKAVLIVSPTYHGICSDVAAIANITHTHNIPLIVDEAHAPHFAFHPELPKSALASGADIAIQSAHKVLSAFTQAAMLHAQGTRVNRDRISQCLQLTQSTSPSYLLLSSLDACRHQMATNGFTLMSQTLALANEAFENLSKIYGLQVLQPAKGDQTRLTVDVSSLGLTGFAADEILHEQFSITAELPALRHVMFIISLGNITEDIRNLVNGFEQLCQLHPSIQNSPLSYHGTGKHISAKSSPMEDSQCLPFAVSRPSITPRQAFFAKKIPTDVHQSIGRNCAETICPYPPGIPILLPGEPITQEAIDTLQAILESGGIITGCTDPTLETILTTANP
ncbi:MAG: aminotransferase class I/II-fold pyridoxal phosphate-dependent enzyme [Cyanobacteria bacterium J06649_4]